ncbi:DUF4123 domain-containing protein [Rodentibacter rarus]|nr:DUF4123 domain-containing protein [Rodentibacter rarus]
MEENYLTYQALENYSKDNLYLILEKNSQVNITHNIVNNDFSILYDGTEYEYLSNLSPVLYLMKRGCSLPEMYNRHYAIRSVFFSPYNINEIATHFKTYLTALLPNNLKSIFRFYSPKILRVLLESNNFDDKHRNRMFSPFSSVFICVDGRFKSLYQNSNVKKIAKEKSYFVISQSFFDEIEELYYDDLLHEIAFDIYLSVPYKVMHIPKEYIIQAIDSSFKMLSQNESLKVKKKFILYRFKYASHYFLFPEFIEAKEKYSLEYALQKLSFNKIWQQKCKEEFDDNHWLGTLKNSE